MKLTRNIAGWMFYDFANSAFTTVIVSVVYSAYFIKSVAAGPVGYGDRLWGLAVGLSMTLVAITAPILGAVADYSRSKKKLLFFFAYLTVLFTALLYFVKAGEVTQGMIFFIAANYAFNSANVFYDAFLPEVSPPADIGKVSGFGWAFGYLGGLVSLLLSLVLVKFNVRYVFPMIALHILVFSLFTLFWLREVHKPSRRTNYLRVAGTRIWYTLRHIARMPNLLKYLVSYFTYNNGIYTVIVFAAPFGTQRFQMGVQDIIVFFILAQLT